MKLDVGNRNSKVEGTISIIDRKFDDGDIIHDLSVFPWPIESDSVEQVFCAYYLERVPDIFAFFDELYRICKKDASIRFISVYYSSIRMTTNLENIHPISEYSFIFLEKKFRESQNIKDYFFDFKANTVAYKWGQGWDSRSEEAKEFARIHYNNVIDDIQVDLSVLK